MKIAKFKHNGKVGEGVVKNGSIAVINAYEVDDPNTAPFTLASKSIDELSAAAASPVAELALDQVQLLPPISGDSKLICLGYNYKTHIDETNAKMDAPPAFFARWPDSIVGHGEPILCPQESNTFDFEGEIAVIMGSGGRRLSPDEAGQCIFGFTCFLDGSIREYQKHSPTAGKNFFRSGSLGPWIVSKDEAGDPNAFALETRVAGEKLQETTGSLMVRNPEEIISYVSRFTELRPGDMIATGTPGGVGAQRTPPRWMKPGEHVEIEIKPIGTLRNEIVEG
ncbi:MAG: fumarylacetoacetate hydrolase family protein [Pseudomonadota bacterium]